MEIANLIIEILSLIATIIVSIAIFWLQRRHEKDIEKQEELRRKEAIIEAAKIFIIDNQEDIHLLPLCVIAASVNPYKNHNRPLYTRFNKFSKELQKEILRQENIPLVIESNSNWVNEYLDRFEEDCKTYNMGKSYLYEGAKYLHYAIKELQKEKLENIDTNVFDVPQWNNFLFNSKRDLTYYIGMYLKNILKDRGYPVNSLELLPKDPPMDMLIEMFDFGSCDMKILNFWLMKFITSACVAFCRHGLIEDSEAEWRQINVSYAKLETYEDMYYDTLLMLYTTYGPKVN